MKDFAKQFYLSKAWRKCRQAFLIFKAGLCERCGEAKERMIVHHKIILTPENIDNPDITLNWDNLELVCQECHNKEHMSKYDSVRDGLRFDENGMLIKIGDVRNENS
ncbi:MAG TPA: HNH endonuclease [Clostridia bacterium]